MNVSPTIALFPEASFGAALNCVGIAQELRRQGARPVFICHPGFTGIFAEYGFMEDHLTAVTAPSAPSSERHWEEFLNTHLPNFNLSPSEQIKSYVVPTWDAIVDSAIAVEDSLRDILAQIRPDVVLLDNVIMFPAIANAGPPWVRVVSCAETEIPDPAVPPYLSGLDPADTAACAAFRKAYVAATRRTHRRYNAFRRKCGLPALPGEIFLENSAHLNLLLAPAGVRYDRANPLPADRFVYLEGCVRRESPFDLPHFPAETGPVIQEQKRLEESIRLAQESYDAIAKRFDNAQITGALGEFEAPERIKVIEAAADPVVPVTPGNMLFALAGILAGILAGAGLAGAAEVLDTRLRSRNQFEHATKVPVIARFVA